MANPYTKMLKMKDEELKKAIDNFTSIAITPTHYIEELWRRNQAKQTNTLKHLTWWIFTFTLVVMISTLLQLAIVLKWIGQ